MNIKTIQRKLKKASPMILTCLGATGVIGTAVLTAVETKKAMEKLEQLKNGEKKDIKKSELAMALGPIYIPAIAAGTATIVCIFGANTLNQRNQASLVSAYALMNESYKNYKNAAVKVFGPDANRKINAEVAREIYVSCDGYAIYPKDYNSEDENVLWFDDLSNRYFYATLAAVINAQYHLNRNMVLRSAVSINELYTFLGIDKVKGGDEIGWSGETIYDGGLMWLDFENRKETLDDGLECYVMSVLIEPENISDWV